MRLMEHHDNPQVVKRDNSTHSSPVPTPSPPPTIIPVNSTLRLTTIFNDVRMGKVAAYDARSNLVTLRKRGTVADRRSCFSHRKGLTFFVDMKGSKAGLVSVAVINLQHCREWAVVQEPNDDLPEPLYPIDLNKVTEEHDGEARTTRHC